MPLAMKAINGIYWDSWNEWAGSDLCNMGKEGSGGRTDSPATCHHLESSQPVIRGQNLEQQYYSISTLVYLVSGDGNAIRPTVAMQQLQSSWGAWQPTAVVLAFRHQAHRGWHARIHGMLRDTRVTIQNTVAVERLTKLTLAWHKRATNDKGTSNQDTPCNARNLPLPITTFMTAHHLPRTCTKLIPSTLYPECSSCTVLIYNCYMFQSLRVKVRHECGKVGQWRTLKILIFTKEIFTIKIILTITVLLY